MTSRSLSRFVEPADRRALLALWAVPHLGVRRLERLKSELTQHPGELLDRALESWIGMLELPEREASQLRRLGTLERLAAGIEQRVEHGQMRVVFQGDADFPAQLAELADAPPLLFVQGVAAPSTMGKLRLAMVGSRHPDGGFLPQARRLARELAESGVVIISGAAEGVDRACHAGALDVQAETWAFVGSALDRVEGAQRTLRANVLRHGGAFFSELPPGVQARPFTFPRRNRLISGASDAVLLLRAGEKSGTMLTAQAAEKQGRPLFAMAGEANNSSASGCNRLLREGRARPCSDAADLLKALGRASHTGHTVATPERWNALSSQAQHAYELISGSQRFAGFDEVMEKAAARGAMQTPVDAAELLSALSELELSGLVVQHAGKLYERV